MIFEKIIQAELAKPKGTPVTRANFEKWQKAFEAEMREKRKRQLEEEFKALPPKGKLSSICLISSICRSILLDF